MFGDTMVLVCQNFVGQVETPDRSAQLQLNNIVIKHYGQFADLLVLYYMCRLL